MLCFVSAGNAFAGPIVFDFMGPRVGSRDSLSFSQDGLLLSARGINVTTASPAMVTQWDFGLGVRTEFPNNGNGDGALDSIGADERLELSFTDARGRPLPVLLDTLDFYGFGDADDLTLWVDGVAVLGPDYHPTSTPWVVSRDVARRSLKGSLFAISVSDEGPTWEDDYFRLSGMKVHRVPEPPVLMLVALGVLVSAGRRNAARTVWPSVSPAA
jgi:hypothetical protein